MDDGGGARLPERKRDGGGGAEDALLACAEWVDSRRERRARRGFVGAKDRREMTKCESAPCRNGFDMIQSQPLRSSFKLIISFTFPSLVRTRNDLTSFQKF